MRLQRYVPLLLDIGDIGLHRLGDLRINGPLGCLNLHRATAAGIHGMALLVTDGLQYQLQGRLMVLSGLHHGKIALFNREPVRL